MTDNANKPAFPQTTQTVPGQNGMTKRELMATIIMAGMLANPDKSKDDDATTKYSVKLTDDLFSELEKQKT